MDRRPDHGRPVAPTDRASGNLSPVLRRVYTCPMPPREIKPYRLLDRIRRVDLRSSSDTELRESFSQLRQRADGGNSNDVLCAVFAIVAEAIDRRLGLWRVFHDSFAERGLTFPSADEPLDVANAVSEVARQRQYSRDGDILLPAEFYEAVRRGGIGGELCFRATDEQILAGIHLFRGSVVQMDAGEGKTVAAAFPAALHALLGSPVHLVTANDYLADRDAKLLEPVYRSLGFTVGAVLQHTEEAERRQVYQRDIVYGSMRELGFDYLRDNLKTDPKQRVQPLDALRDAVAIVDEADHALIDEALTPMIISGNPAGTVRTALQANRVVAEMIMRQREISSMLAAELDAGNQGSNETARRAASLLLADPDNPELMRYLPAESHRLRKVWGMAEDDHESLSADQFFCIHPGRRFVTLTDNGRDFLEQYFGPLYDDISESKDDGLRLAGGRRTGQRKARKSSRRYGLANQVLQSLRAHLLLQNGVDYLVGDDGVVLIDPHTGRAKPDSIYQMGLQAAVEAREGVRVNPESETLAWISVSGFISRYRHIAGITGTAVPSAGEFRQRYGLEVAAVPPVKASKRTVCPPKVYLTRNDKIAAVVDEAEDRHLMGQPVLVAARTVEQSEELSRELAMRHIPHQLLNAVTSASEARIVREAKNFGAVTVSTAMAGRGTDIVLKPDLTELLAERCAARVGQAVSEGVSTVHINCPSQAEAAVLLRALTGRGLSCELDDSQGAVRLTVKGGEGGGLAGLRFGLGLCVIGTELYESHRTELQLHGRSGRQGDFGMTQTFLSLEDQSVRLHGEDILRLPGFRQTDDSGRAFFSGPRVSRVVERLQEAADSEAEALRGLLHDYAAEFDRHTRLYYWRRDGVAGSEAGYDLCQQAAGRVAARLAAERIGTEADEDYQQKFQRMAEELRLDYGVDCSSLYGCDLAQLSAELEALFVARLEGRFDGTDEHIRCRMVRLLFLQVCGELWPRHLDVLRDLMASQMLTGMNHKSAVAQYIARCQGAWREFWATVDSEFVSRLMFLSTTPQADEPNVAASRETEALLAQDALSPL